MKVLLRSIRSLSAKQILLGPLTKKAWYASRGFHYAHHTDLQILWLSQYDLQLFFIVHPFGLRGLA